MHLTSWGCYPQIETHYTEPESALACATLIKNSQSLFTPRGLGRSYGDSALGSHTLSTQSLTYFHEFDSTSGLLTCDAGMSLSEILKVFVPHGWFLPVTPGTQFISVGGAIASDVHGKNHHIEGCFSQHVRSFKLLLASGEILTCSLIEHSDLFHATCGGMGLTGIILEASFYLKRIQSTLIEQQSFKAHCLEQAFEFFEEHANMPYSVAWIDCLSRGPQLGRSVVMTGQHATSGPLHLTQSKKINIPCNMPSRLLNPFSIQLFNALYFHKAKQGQQHLHYEKFFYPLDTISNWNRLYGKQGFTQYQFVLTKDAGYEGMKAILARITASRRGSFLAVLKALGTENKNLLSFPMEGYTLALDFKMEAGLFAFLDELDQIVLEYGGRLYLTKDVRMSESMFKQSYPRFEEFIRIRKQYGADQRFQSLQSKRLNI